MGIARAASKLGRLGARAPWGSLLLGATGGVMLGELKGAREEKKRQEDKHPISAAAGKAVFAVSLGIGAIAGVWAIRRIKAVT